MSGSSRESVSGGREALTDVRVWSGGPPVCPGVVGRPSQMYGTSQEAVTGGCEALTEVRE